MSFDPLRSYWNQTFYYSAPSAPVGTSGYGDTGSVPLCISGSKWQESFANVPIGGGDRMMNTSHLGFSPVALSREGRVWLPGVAAPTSASDTRNSREIASVDPVEDQFGNVTHWEVRV